VSKQARIPCSRGRQEHKGLRQSRRVRPWLPVRCQDFRANKIEVAGKRKRVLGVVFDPETRAAKTDFVIEAPIVIISASAANSSGQVWEKT